MPIPIQKEHELLCPGCGCVLNEGLEVNDPNEQKTIINSPDIFMLGSALQNNVKFSLQRTPKQIYEEKALKFIFSITKKYSLPDSIAFDTFFQLKRNNRGIRSEKEPIKQLLKILSKDDNYRYFKTMKLIKARYENNNSF